jgi:c-di-GMP-binding flagellar brake protein YcgR
MPLKRKKSQPNPSPEPGSPAERRRYPRASKNLAIKITDREADFVTETQNISCIGAYCHIDSYLPILTKLKISIVLPKTRETGPAQHIVCEGTVVRIEKGHDTLENFYHVAVYFNKISKGDMRLIDQYVKHHLAKSATVSKI